MQLSHCAILQAHWHKQVAQTCLYTFLKPFDCRAPTEMLLLSAASSSGYPISTELTDVIVGGVRTFDLVELRRATDDFSDQNVVGSGGFGSVYKGVSQG
jgi:hypothetical protein